MQIKTQEFLQLKKLKPSSPTSCSACMLRSLYPDSTQKKTSHKTAVHIDPVYTEQKYKHSYMASNVVFSLLQFPSPLLPSEYNA